jgi:divalent metal cation (Fe/Co/Zn/Cd) transporter
VLVHFSDHQTRKKIEKNYGSKIKFRGDEGSVDDGVEEESKSSKAQQATKVGAVVNVSLAVCKGAVGIGISSPGVIADAANSLSDLLIDAVVYYSLIEARRGSNKDSPWGRGKIESIGKLVSML